MAKLEHNWLKKDKKRSNFRLTSSSSNAKKNFCLWLYLMTFKTTEHLRLLKVIGWSLHKEEEEGLLKQNVSEM